MFSNIASVARFCEKLFSPWEYQVERSWSYSTAFEFGCVRGWLVRRALHQLTLSFRLFEGRDCL
jgi:hypothetical protein